MKCHEVQEALGIYWDLDENDPERLTIDGHLRTCPSCKEEFEIWEESERLIRGFSQETDSDQQIDDVNRAVMDRIYAEQSWLMPVTSRSYQFTRTFRRNVTAVIACCLAIFVCGLFYIISGSGNTDSGEQVAKLTGVLETASAASDDSVISAAFYADVPVASISDPIILKVVPTIPQYWVALSLLGIIMTLLILNWFSRTRN